MRALGTEAFQIIGDFIPDICFVQFFFSRTVHEFQFVIHNNARSAGRISLFKSFQLRFSDHQIINHNPIQLT